MAGPNTSVVSAVGAIHGSKGLLTSADNSKEELKSSGCDIHKIACDNTGGSQTVYPQLFDATAAGVTLGTTVPNCWVKVRAGKKLSASIRNITDGSGMAFATALTTVTTTAPKGTTSPTTPPTLEVSFS